MSSVAWETFLPQGLIGQFFRPAVGLQTRLSPPHHSLVVSGRVKNHLLMKVEPESAARLPPAVILTRQLEDLKDSSAILELVQEKKDEMNVGNAATALRGLASVSRKNRRSKQALFHDPRFAHLLDTIEYRSTELVPRSLADVLWSLAMLEHFPPRLLKPVLKSVAAMLEKKDFKADDLSTLAWAIASLRTSPRRTIGFTDMIPQNDLVPKSVSDIIAKKIEPLALPLVSSMNNKNCADLLWAFARLGHRPIELLPKIVERLVEPGMVSQAKPVEVQDIAYALAEFQLCSHIDCSAPGAYNDLIIALATRAMSQASLIDFSSRQLVALMCAILRMEASALLPDGVLDEWIDTVRVDQEARPLMVKDANSLQAALEALGRDASWVKNGKARKYTNKELLAKFKDIEEDNSGYVDQEKLIEAIKQIEPNADMIKVKEVLKSPDVDSDRRFSFDDFKEIMRAQVKLAFA